MAEQLLVDTYSLTKDIFDAEQRTDRGEKRDFVLPKPMSAAEVVTEYANKYTDGDVDKLVDQLNGQSYRLTEVINHAVENPYSYSEYDKLVKIRETTPQAAPEAPVDYLDMEVESVGEMGVFWDDVPVEEYDTVAVSKVDDNYQGLIKAAEMTEGILSDSATQEMLKWEDRQDIDTKWIQTNTIENLNKQGKFLGQDGFDDAYNKEFKKVTNTLMLKNVQGVHNATPRMALSEWADPSSALGSEVIAAMSPQMKFLGVGKANQLLYVTESNARYFTDIIDAPKMAGIGLLKYGPSEFERGIAERSMATTELYKAGAATGIPGLQYLGGLTGLVLDIGTPDLTVVGGIAVKGAKMAVKTGTKLNKAVKGLQDVTKVAPESEIVAKRLMEIGKTLEKAAETGDRAAVKEASRQYAELRGEYPALRKQIDRGVESYQAERVEQIKDAVKSTDFEPDDVRALQAREALQSAGELKLKRVVSTTENVDDVIGELARDIELRVGKRKEEAQGPIFAFDTADTPRFDFQFNALDKAEQALVKKGEYRTDTEKVRKQFISIIAAKMNEFKDAAGVKTVSTDDPDIAKVFRSLIGTKNKRPINEVKDDLLLVIEKRAGIGNHSDEALFKAETNISKLISKYADEKIDVFEEAAAARNLRIQKAEAANIKKEKTIKEARQLQKDIDAELKVLRRNQRLKVQAAKRIGDDLTDAELRLSGAQEIASRSKAVKLAVQKINRLEKIKTQLINKGARLIEASLLQKMEDAKFIAKYYKTDATRKAVEKSVIEYNSIMAKIDFGSVWRNDRRNIIDADAITSEIFKDYIETLYTELEQHRKRLTRLRGRIKTDSSRQALERYKALTRQYNQATETVKAYKQEVKLLKAELAATNKQLRQINSFVGKLERQLKKSLRKEAGLKAKKAGKAPKAVSSAISEKELQAAAKKVKDKIEKFGDISPQKTPDGINHILGPAYDIVGEPVVFKTKPPKGVENTLSKKYPDIMVQSVPIEYKTASGARLGIISEKITPLDKLPLDELDKVLKNNFRPQAADAILRLAKRDIAEGLDGALVGGELGEALRLRTASAEEISNILFGPVGLRTGVSRRTAEDNAAAVELLKKLAGDPLFDRIADVTRKERMMPEDALKLKNIGVDANGNIKLLDIDTTEVFETAGKFKAPASPFVDDIKNLPRLKTNKPFTKTVKAKKVKEVAPQIDIEGAVKRFDEQLIDSVVDAVDDLADYFYGRGKLFAALEQVAATRAAVNFNMKTTGEALQLLASRIEAGKRISATMLLDTATTREIRNTASVQELISRKPDLDPAAVPSALELLATKYGVTAEAISDGILNNKPIAATKPSGETVLIDANLVSKTYLSEGHAAFVSARRQSPKYSLRESFEGIDQESASGAIDVMLKTEGTDASVFKRAAEFVKNSTLGGTVSPELLNLSPPMRKMIQRLSRSVSQTVGDVANLLEQGDPKAIVSYLAGQKGTFSNKRQILSSGLPSVASVYNQTIERVILKLSVKSSEDADAVRWLLSQDLNSNTGRLDINLLKAREPEKYERAAKTLQQMFVTGAKSKAVDTAKTAKETAEAMTDFEKSLAAGELQTIPMPRAITDLLEFVQPDYLNAEEVTTETATFIHALYNAGNKNMSAEDAIKALITGVKNAYTGGDSAVAVERGLTALHRALPIMAAHTKAYAVIHEIGDFSLALSKTDYENWVNYTKGLPVPLEWRQTKLQELIDLTGDSVMFRAVEVMGEDRYLPREAFTAMNRALKRAEDKGVISRAGADISSESGFMDYLQSIVTKMMAVRVYGALMFRSRFGIDSLYEGVSAAMQIGGMTPSVLHGVRQFSQVPAMFPGALHITHFTGRLASWATKLFDPTGPLDGAPEIVKDFARVVAEKATREDLQSYLQSIGDAAANKLAGFIGAGKWNLDVNKMLAGSDEIVEIQGAQYTYRTLRDMLVEEGVPGGSLQANYFANRLRKKLTGFGDEAESVLSVVDILKMPFDEAVDLHKMITAFSESLGERERLSMFCAFVSSGYTPIEAAEMTRRALFDYQESLSKFDYHIAVRMLIPYWTFHKNNARLQFDSMFDPITAYRAGVVRKGPEAAMKLVQESVDDYYTDELGIQTNLLSDERQEALALYKKTLLGQLGQDRFTEEQTSFIRSMIVGIPAGYQDKGRVFGTGADTIELNAIRDILGVTDAMQVNPYVAGYVKKYQQGRPVFFFPTDLNDPETDFRKQIGASAVFNYLALPESGQAAFASHVLAMGGASTMLALGVTEMAGVHDLASSEVFFKGATESAETFFSPDFNPVMNLILKGIGAETQQGQASVRISEASYNFLKQAGSDSIYEVPAEMVGDKVLKPQRYYMSAYGAAMLNMIPVISQAAKEVTDLGKENIALTGDPVFDFSLNTMRLFGLQIERGDREAVMRQAQPSDTIRTYRPQN